MSSVRSNAEMLPIFLLVYITIAVHASHFRGAIVTWEPTDEPNQVTISWRISWRRSRITCSQSHIDSGQLINGEGQLQCYYGCSGNLSPMSFYCTDFSTSEDWTTGVNSIVFDATNAEFGVKFSGNAWISVNIGGGTWSLPATVNLTQRTDTGRPNSSPRSAITPIVRLQHGCNHTLVIPTNDPDGDTVRCRWAIDSEECGGVCNSFPHAQLEESTCTIRYEAIYQTSYFAVALMIEDFAQPLSTSPLSKIPLQFLVFVYTNEGPCSSAPEFVDPTPRPGACVGITPNTTYSEPLVARTGDKDVSITNIDTISPLGFSKSPVGKVTGLERDYYVNITWTPQPSQFGENIMCFTAEDSASLSSDQQCITFVAGVAAPKIIPNSLDPPPNSHILSSHTTWRMQFDAEFVRPTQPTFIRFFTKGGTNVYSIDVASRPDVLYLSSVDRSVEFDSEGLLLQEKQTYYILMEWGIAKGLEFCGPESSPIRDSSFWSVTIKDTSPPILQFIDKPSISNDAITISWNYNERSNSSCTVQAPDQRNNVVDCDLSWTGRDLTEGSYAIYISGTDEAGNVALPKVHSWRVDLTPPTVRISTNPPSPSRDQSARFQFTCNEVSCTYECSLVKEDESPSFSVCNSRSYTGNDLDGSVFYVFYVRATDQVGNGGAPSTYKWYIDTTPPVILSVAPVALSCGQDFTPIATGFPTVTDTYDSNPSVMYTDKPSDGCVLQRVWMAMDSAGNEASVTQNVTFSNPQPPILDLPTNLLIPCGDPINDHRRTEDFVADQVLSHPCNRSMNVSYQNSVEQILCGFTFTRYWYVVDDCGNSVSTQQNIKVLELQMPDQPEDGQVNVDLRRMLKWPQYPGSSEFRIFIWLENDLSRPQMPILVTTALSYQPFEPYTPNTRYLWQVEYVLATESNSLLNVTVVPSPVWGFETRTFADFSVANVFIPSQAFSGQDLTVSWTVENSGSRGSAVSTWYDDIYLSLSPEYGAGARRVLRQRRSLFLDPSDGYSSSATFRLQQHTIGLYYIFVVTDSNFNIDDYDRGNNIRRSETPVEIRLTPPPDLVVSDIVAPETSYSGEDIDVIFTVRNSGTGVTSASRWHDAILWSSNNVTSNRDTRLAVILHDNGLPPNAEYIVRQTVTVPRRIIGNFWISVITDIFNAVYEHVSEENNGHITQIPINVLLSPPPDLSVLLLEVPARAESATTIRLHWVVTNIGFTKPYETYWRDRLILSAINGERSAVLTTQPFSGDLEVDDTYSRSVDYIIPSQFPNGIYNISLYVDYYGQVFEHTYRANNIVTKQITVTQLLPDLSLEYANATISLDSQNEQALLYLFWRVHNIGDGLPGRNEWVDRAYLSNSLVFSTRTAIALGDVIHRVDDEGEEVSGFPPGSSYFATAMFTLAQDIYGQLYVHLRADYRNAVIQKSNELANDVKSVMIDIPSRSSNLMVLSIDITADDDTSSKTDFYSGQEVTIAWNVSNAGNWATDRTRWVDAVYISRVPYIDSAARLLATIEHEGKLFPREGYTQMIHELIFPDDLWGEFYVLIKADNHDSVYDISDGAAKISALRISLQVPPSPELVVTGLEYSLNTQTRRRKRQVQGEETRLLTVKWVTQNTGNSMVRYFVWKDAVIISKERGNVRSPIATLLTTFSVTGNLRAGQSYEFIRTVIVPDGVDGGSFYVYVIPDYFHVLTLSNAELITQQLFDTDEPLDIPERARPDLEAIYSHGIPSEVLTGQFVSITFSGINAGGITNTNSWIDAIYMDDTNADKDATKPDASALLVHQVRHIGRLGYDSQYQVDTQFQIPFSIRGSYAIFVELDYLKSLDDTNENNNFLRIPSDVTVLAAPLPDLIVDVQEAISVRSGEPFYLNITIKNIGLAVVNQTMHNGVYLSEDVDVDSFDIRIINTELYLNLEVNTTRYVQLDLFMPFDIPSADYYVIVHIDSRNDVYETDNNNNVAYTLATIEESFSTDVAVISVVPPPSPVTYSTDMTIQWTLRNNGSEEAFGYKCDTVYFSEDNMWSIDDAEIDTQCGSVNLQPFNNDATHDMSYSMTSSVPLITPKGYRTLVRSRSNIRDLNLENNVGVAQSITDVDIDILNLDEPKDITLGINEQMVFRVPELRAEETVIFQIISDTPTDFNEIYVRHGEIATTGFYDVSGVEFLSPNQNAVIAKSRAGDYYVLIRKKGTTSSSAQSLSTVTLMAKYARLEILDVFPREAAPLGTVTLRISGTLFPEEVSVVLEDQHMNEIVSDNVYHFTSLEMYATFNITGVEVGSNLKLRVRDAYSETVETEFSNALEVINGRPGTLNFRFDNPGRLPPLETGRIRLFVQNVGDADLLTPILKLELTGDATFKVVEASQQSNSTTVFTVYAVPQRGPGGILSPGSTSLITFDVIPNSFGTLGVRFRVTELPPSTAIDNPYAQNRALFKPYEIDNASWDRVWLNFLSATGSSLSSLSSQLSKTANQLSLIGRRIVDVEEMVTVQAKLADGFQSGNVLYSRTDLSIGSQDSGLHAAEIVRSYSPRLSHRNFVGAFGRGWSSPYLSTQLRKVTIGYAVLVRGQETLLFPVTSYNHFEIPFIGQIEVKESEILFIDAALSAKSIYHFHKTTYRLRGITNEFDNSSLSFVYKNDDISKVDSITSSLGSRLNFEYNSHGLVDIITVSGDEVETQVSRYTYDNNFEYLSSVEVEGNILHYQYTSDGALESVRSPTGAHQDYVYNDDGLYSGSATFDQFDNMENRVTFIHDNSGKVIALEEPKNDTTVYIFDEIANVGYVKTLGTLSHRFVRNYSTGKKTIYIGDQILSQQSYDVTTDTLTVVDANGAINSLGLQPNGDVNFIKDGEGNKRTASYESDLLINVTFADGSKEEYFYDDNESLKSFRTRAGDTLSYESDESGNVVKKEIPGEEPSYYRYDNKGFIVEAANGVGKLLITYTDKGLPSSVQYPNGRLLNYVYDEQSRRIELNDNAGYNISYAYNSNGRLIDVVDNTRSDSKLLEVDFDSLGRIKRRTTGNGCFTEYAYDPRGKKVKTLETLCPDHADANDASIFKAKYGYDSRNRIKAMNTTSGNWRFQYDATSQVTSWVDPNGEETLLTYDNAQNRRVLSQDDTSTAYSVNNLNQYEAFGNDIEFEYDANGNLVEILDKAEGKAERFVYSADGQLIGMATPEQDCSFTYDALGNLYEKTCSGKTTAFLVDPFGYFGADVVAEINEEGVIYYTHAFYHGLVAMVPDNDTNIYFYHYDALGSVLGLTDQTQILRNTYQYDPFGNIVESEEAVPNPYTYIGQWGVRKIKESNELYYMRARFYNSRFGRFLTLDPYGIGGKSTNLYSYANNNPLENIDPRGTAIPWIAAGIIGAVVNTGVYTVSQVISGEKFTLGGFTGAALSGAAFGAASVTIAAAAIPAAAGLALTAVAGGLASAGDNLLTNSIDGNDIDPGKLRQDTLIGALTANLPLKPFLYSSGNKILGKVLSKTLEKIQAKPGLATVLDGLVDIATGTTVKQTVNAIKEGVKHAWPIVEDAFDNSVDYAKDRLNDFNDIASDLIRDAGDFADQIGSTISDTTGQIKDRIVNELDDIASKAVDTAADIIDTVDGAFNDIQDTIGEATRNIGDSLQDGFDGIKNSLGDAASDIQNTLGNTLGDLRQTAADGYDDIKDGIKNAYEDVSDAFGSGAGAIGDTIDDAISNVLDADSFDDAVDALQDAAREISDTLGNTADSITESVDDAINDIKNGAGEALDNFSESLSDTAGELKDTVKDTVQDIADVASDTWDDIKDTTSEALDAISDTASDALGDVSDAIDEAISDIGDGLSDALDDVGDILDGARDALGNALEDVLGDVGDAVDDAGDLVDKIIDDAKEGFGKFLDDLLDWPRSRDPNDIIGPAGYGDARFIPIDAVLLYKIRFENDVNATAPAQRVFIETVLDDDIDIRTLRVGSYGFGNFSQEVTNPSGFLQENLDLVDSLGVYVNVRAGLDILTQQVTWELITINPETGRQPSDPSIGFLPPNPENGTDGQGFVTFSARAKRDAEDLTVIDAKARIIFDQNDPIDTPPIFNTIDAGFPSVNMTVVEETLSSGILAVELQKKDEASGVNYVDILVETDAGTEIVVEGVRDKIVTLNLPMGKTHSIVAIATDNVGNTPSTSTASGVSSDKMIVEIYFPEIEVSCDRVHNCSGFGTCIGDNLCDCIQGRYGDDCNSDIAPIEPPIIGFQASQSFEDSSIDLAITVRTADNSPDSKTELVVRNVPQGAMLNYGTQIGNEWSVPLEFLPDLAMIPPPNLDGNVTLLFIATTTTPTGVATREVYLPLTLAAVADAVILDIEPTCFSSGQMMIPLTVGVQPSDSDGSENITLMISSVPQNASLSPAEKVMDGQFLVQQGDLKNLQLILSTPNLLPSSITLNMTVTSTETSNGDTWVDSTNLEITRCKDLTNSDYSTLLWIIASCVMGVGFIILVIIVICYIYLRRNKDPAGRRIEKTLDASDNVELTDTQF